MRHSGWLLYVTLLPTLTLVSGVSPSLRNTADVVPTPNNHNNHNTQMIPTGFLLRYHTTRRVVSIRSRYGTKHRNRNRWFAAMDESSPQPRTIETVAVVGGGLAGLSTACHLLVKSRIAGRSSLRVTVIDKDEVGCGGASAVAGGLLHPFSPQGKLVYLGREGLSATNSLLQRAIHHEPECVIRDHLYRVAMDDKSSTKLHQTADLYPEYASWLEPSVMEERCGTPSSAGGLILSNGCKVIHVPSYLRGLWGACRDLSDGDAEWCVEQSDDVDWKHRLADYDAVVFAAGAGLIQDNILSSSNTMVDLPATLVRGQSIEMIVKNPADSRPLLNEAVLCGKYAAPVSLREANRVLIGATHEFREEKMSEEEVYNELRERSFAFLPNVWGFGEVDKVTCGYRVQSQRGAFGRLPIVGRAPESGVHENAWLFTGLSSRGLIYHGVCGDVLSDAILEDNEEVVARMYPELSWWK